MRKIALIVSLLALLSGCTPSKEEKAERIVKTEMDKILFDFDQYEPIQTRIDSAFTSIYTDMDVVKAAQDYIRMNKEAEYNKEMIQRKYDLASSSASLSRNMNSEYSREKYRQAKKEMDTYARQLKEIDEDIESQLETVREKAEAVVENQFCGWNIFHRYRHTSSRISLTHDYGTPQIRDVLIIVDENMEHVKGRFILDNDDNYSFGKLKKIIDKSIGNNR